MRAVLVVLAALLLAGCAAPERPELVYLQAMVDARDQMLDAAGNATRDYNRWQNGELDGQSSLRTVARSYAYNQEAEKLINSHPAPGDFYPAIARDMKAANDLMKRGYWLLYDSMTTGGSDPADAIAKLEDGAALLDRMGPMLSRAISEV